MNGNAIIAKNCLSLKMMMKLIANAVQQIGIILIINIHMLFIIPKKIKKKFF
jgi:hypothetical protein